ncbi:MAG: cytochrome c3 family protein [Desulfobacterium sp.]|jgi:hypothetical protein|nr:cytochrome c3 family protein [Desulfobacterium sp.]
MKNLSAGFLVFIAIMATTCLVVWAQGDFEAPDDGLEINYIEGNSERDLSVMFNHSSHESYDCAECHHKMHQLKEGQPPRSCATCHTEFDINETRGYKPYFKAMHMIKESYRPSCIACHTKEFGQDQDMTGCTNSACHSDGLY